MEFAFQRCVIVVLCCLWDELSEIECHILSYYSSLLQSVSQKLGIKELNSLRNIIRITTWNK